MIVKYFIIFGLLFCLAAACQPSAVKYDGPKYTMYVDATISIDVGADVLYDVPDYIIELKSAQDIEKLVSFFPGVNTGQKSPIGGGWGALVVIRLMTIEGKTIKIMTDGKYWSEGQGDWELSSAAVKYLEGQMGVHTTNAWKNSVKERVP